MKESQKIYMFLVGLKIVVVFFSVVFPVLFWYIGSNYLAAQ